MPTEIEAINSLDELRRASGPNARGSSEVTSLRDRMKLEMQSSQKSGGAGIKSSMGIASMSGLSDEVGLPVEPDDPPNDLPINVAEELLRRLREMKLDPDPKKAAKQIIELVKTFRDPSRDEIVFRNIEGYLTGVGYCLLMLKKSAGGDDEVSIPPMDEVGISLSEEELIKALELAQIQLWGLSIFIQKWRGEMMNPEPGTWGSRSLQFDC